MSAFNIMVTVGILLFVIAIVLFIVGSIIDSIKTERINSKVPEYTYDINEHESYWREYL